MQTRVTLKSELTGLPRGLRQSDLALGGENPSDGEQTLSSSSLSSSDSSSLPFVMQGELVPPQWDGTMYCCCMRWQAPTIGVIGQIAGDKPRVSSPTLGGGETVHFGVRGWRFAGEVREQVGDGEKLFSLAWGENTKAFFFRGGFLLTHCLLGTRRGLGCGDGGALVRIARFTRDFRFTDDRDAPTFRLQWGPQGGGSSFSTSQAGFGCT